MGTCGTRTTTRYVGRRTGIRSPAGSDIYICILHRRLSGFHAVDRRRVGKRQRVSDGLRSPQISYSTYVPTRIRAGP